MRFDFKRVLELFEAGSSQISQCKDLKLNLIVGPTGAGKSTVVNALLGHLLSIDGNGKVTLQNPADPNAVANTNIATIGHGAQSETLYPSLYHIEGAGIHILDCAGYGDTRSVDYRVGISMAMESTIKNAAAVNSIFVVINYHDLIASRGDSAKKLASLIANLFSDLEQAEHSINFVITHVDELYDQAYGALCRKQPKKLVNNPLGFERDVEAAIKSKQVTAVGELVSALKAKVSMVNYAKHAAKKKMAGWLGGETEQDETDLPDEAVEVGNAITILSMLHASIEADNAFIFNPIDAAHINVFRERVRAQIVKTENINKPIPVGAFQFSSYDNERVNFEAAVRTSAWLYTKKIEQLESMPAAYATLADELTTLQTLIEQQRAYVAGTNTANASPDRAGLINAMAETIAVQIAGYETQIAAKQAEIRAKSLEKSQLESDELVHDEYPYKEPRMFLFGKWAKSRKIYEIPKKNGTHHSYEAKKGKDKISLEKLEAGDCELKLRYESARGEDGDCTLTISYKKRHYKNNPDEIQTLSGDINTLNSDLYGEDGLRRKLTDSQEQRRALISTTANDANANARLINGCEAAIVSNEAKILTCLTKRNLLAESWVEKVAEYRVHQSEMLTLTNILLVCSTVKADDFIGAFQNFDTSGVIDQTLDGVEVAAPIPQEIPAHFLSDLNGALMTVPVVITACDHTMDSSEFNNLFADDTAAACPCCTDGATTVDRHDRTTFSINTPLTNEIASHLNRRNRADGMQANQTGDELITQLRATIEDKARELTRLRERLDRLVTSRTQQQAYGLPSLGIFANPQPPAAANPAQAEAADQAHYQAPANAHDADNDIADILAAHQAINDGDDDNAEPVIGDLQDNIPVADPPVPQGPGVHL